MFRLTTSRRLNLLSVKSVTRQKRIQLQPLLAWIGERMLVC